MNKARLELSIDPIWDYVPATRNYLQSLLNLYMQDRKKTEKIIIVFSELLENAVKYSKGGPVKILLLNLDQPTKLEIIISNQAVKKHALVLYKMLRELRTASGQGYYIKKLREVSRYKDCRVSLIGLARIHYETGAKLSARFWKGNIIKVRAVFSCFGEE